MGSERCSDCRHNQEGYCDVQGREVDSDKKPCPEFEEQ